MTPYGFDSSSYFSQFIVSFRVAMTTTSGCWRIVTEELWWSFPKLNWRTWELQEVSPGCSKNRQLVPSEQNPSVFFPLVRSAAASDRQMTEFNSTALYFRLNCCRQNTSVYVFIRQELTQNKLDFSCHVCLYHSGSKQHICSDLWRFLPLTIRNSGKTTNSGFNHWLRQAAHENNTITNHSAKLSRQTLRIILLFSRVFAVFVCILTLASVASVCSALLS